VRRIVHERVVQLPQIAAGYQDLCSPSIAGKKNAVAIG
jgi:hypothetical protein